MSPEFLLFRVSMQGCHSPFLLVSGGPGAARKLGETGRNRPVTFWSVSDHRSPRNDQKREKVTFFESVTFSRMSYMWAVIFNVEKLMILKFDLA